MFDCRDLRERSGGCTDNSRVYSGSCACNRWTGIIALILASLFFLVLGIIIGAFLAIFVITSLVPIAILALVLLLALLTTLFISRSEKSNRC